MKQRPLNILPPVTPAQVETPTPDIPAPHVPQRKGATPNGLQRRKRTIPPNAGCAMTLTADQLSKLFPGAKTAYLQEVCDDLNHNPASYTLDSGLRLAHFFAQLMQEAGSALTEIPESLNYKPQGLIANFGYYEQHPAEAAQDGRQQDAAGRILKAADQTTIANKAYANRNGNGDIASGDGWRFRGRGFIQVTGRSNYAATTTSYRTVYADNTVDFAATPELLEHFPYTLRSAVCYWVGHQLCKKADQGSTDTCVDSITRVINSLTNSYADRQANFRSAFAVLAS